MKIIAISDTHGLHENLALPQGDMIIHAGDVSRRGELKEVQSFLTWFKSLPHRYKIFVAGNHDFLFEQKSNEFIDSIVPQNVIYLNDSGIQIEGINIWGSPITPTFFNWAFNRDRGSEIQRHWNLIPSNTDILITHGPAFRRLDQTITGSHVGCKDLFNKINEIYPSLHICGHIHEAYGSLVEGDTVFLNCSQVNLSYELVNDPMIFNLDQPG